MEASPDRNEQALIERKEESGTRGKQPLTNLDANDDAFTAFVKTATSAAVQELDCLAISGLIKTKTLLNAYTMIFKIKGCLQYLRISTPYLNDLSQCTKYGSFSPHYCNLPACRACVIR